MYSRSSSAGLTIILALTLSACSQKEGVPGTVSQEVSSDAVHHDISSADIANTSYTILSPAVRYRLTAAGEDFSVRLKNGAFEFSHPALVAPYSEVHLLSEFTQYGDLAGDTKEEAVAILEIGHGDDARKEVAVLSESGGTVRHIASYLLGHADVLSVRIKKKAMYVKARHSLPGDPGLRTTEFVFVVEKP